MFSIFSTIGEVERRWLRIVVSFQLFVLFYSWFRIFLTNRKRLVHSLELGGMRPSNVGKKFRVIWYTSASFGRPTAMLEFPKNKTHRDWREMKGAEDDLSHLEFFIFSFRLSLFIYLFTIESNEMKKNISSFFALFHVLCCLHVYFCTGNPWITWSNPIVVPAWWKPSIATSSRRMRTPMERVPTIPI